MTKAAAEALIAKMLARDEANRVLSQQLSARLAGNYKVTLKERPDGTGYFYGLFVDEHDRSRRVDVMPPRPLWSGDFKSDVADPTHWVVSLDGEEVQRAETIEGLTAITMDDTDDTSDA